jgi:hypothetical protein
MMRLMFGQFFWVWIVSFLGAASFLSWISIQELMRLSKTKTYTVPATKLMGFGNNKRQSASVILRGSNMFDPDGSMVEPPKTPTKPAKRADTRKEPPKKSEIFGCPYVDRKKEIPLSKIKRVRIKGTSYVESDPNQSVVAMYVRVTFKTPVPKSSAPPPPRRRKRYYKRRRRRYLRRNRRRRYRRSRSRGRTRTRWQTEIFKVGDLMMDNIRVCAIGPKDVVFYRNRKLEKLTLDTKKKKKKWGFFGSFGLPGQGDKGNSEVRIDAVDKRTISRATVQGWLSNPMAHAMNARIMPHYEGGRSKGLRLVWVRKKSLYSQLGLKTGDVVQSINGKALSLSNALGLYSQLPYAKQIKVNVIRRGVRRQLSLTVK